MHNYSAAAVSPHSDLLSVSQLGRQELLSLLALARDLRSKSLFGDSLRGKSVALIFEKPSLRTRVTFEVAIRQLGGWPIMLGSAESRLGEREPIQDLALRWRTCAMGRAGPAAALPRSAGRAHQLGQADPRDLLPPGHHRTG